MVDPIAIVEGCIVIGSSINRAIQSVRSHKNDCMELEEQMEDLLAPLRKLQAVKHIKKEDEEDLKRFCNRFEAVLEKMEELVNELQQDRGVMGKAWDFGRAMLGQDPIRDKLQEIDKDLEKLTQVAILRIHWKQYVPPESMIEETDPVTGMKNLTLSQESSVKSGGAVRLEKHESFTTQLLYWELTRYRGTPRGHSILCGRAEEGGPVVVHKYSARGKLLYTWEVEPCPDRRPRAHSVLEVQKQILINNTGSFSLILLPDNPTGSEQAIYKDPTKKIKPQDICIGPGHSILAVNAIPNSKSVWHFGWEGDKLVFKKKIPIQTDFPPHIIYDKQNDLLIVSDYTEKEIWAYKLETHNEVWRYGDKNKNKIKIGGVEIMPCAMALDHSGRLYVADGKNARVLVIDVKTGTFRQCLDLPELGTVRDIAWSDEHFTLPGQDMLTAVHMKGSGLGITHFAILPK